MKLKKITHDYLTYIINKVLLSIPELEYIDQFMILTEQLFKNHLKLLISTHNNIIHNKLFPNIQSFFLSQFYTHCTLTNILFNSPSSLTMGYQKILRTQQEIKNIGYLTSKDLIFTGRQTITTNERIKPL